MNQTQNPYKEVPSNICPSCKITCSKSTIKTVEQGVKYVQIKQKRQQNDTTGIVLVSLLFTLNIFHTLF